MKELQEDDLLIFLKVKHKTYNHVVSTFQILSQKVDENYTIDLLAILQKSLDRALFFCIFIQDV